jgi:hypothetical protein
MKENKRFNYAKSLVKREDIFDVVIPAKAGIHKLFIRMDANQVQHDRSVVFNF